MDRLSELEVFVRVIENDSFTMTVDKLNMPRAMVSKYIIALEIRLGARLLNRTMPKLGLIEAGRHFYHQTQEILLALGEAEAQVSKMWLSRAVCCV